MAGNNRRGNRGNRGFRVPPFTTAALVVCVILLIWSRTSGGSGSAEEDQTVLSNSDLSDQGGLSVATTSGDQTLAPVGENVSAVSDERFLPESVPDEYETAVGDCDVKVLAAADADSVAVTITPDGGDLDGAEVCLQKSDGTRPTATIETVEEGKSSTADFKVPMTDTHMTYHLTVRLSDDDRTVEESVSPELLYTEDLLEALNWNQGTFDQVTDSVDYHFDKHHSEVDADNMQEYLIASDDCRSDVLSDPEDYRETQSSGEIPAHKYKNRDDDSFIILTDSGDEILSFGR